MTAQLPNLLSCLRGALAVLFFQEKIYVRVTALVLAVITDILDGYLARRLEKTSGVGAVLDPIMDRVFFLVVSFVLFQESRLSTEIFFYMLSRDLAILFFVLFLLVKKSIKKYPPRALLTGKVTTGGQFLVLGVLTVGIKPPFLISYFFLVLGVLAFVELFYTFYNRPSLYPSNYVN